MSPRNMLLVIVAVFFAAGTAMFVRKQSEVPVEQGEVAPPTATRILVAKREIPVGAFVKPEMDLEWAAWPEDTIQNYHVREGSEDASSFAGAVARRAIHVGEAATAQSLIKPGAGGFLSVVLEPGKRAVSVAVSPTSGTAGFIFPGDFVDMIVTHRLKVRETPQSADEETVISETFVENVRVVAVDQMLDNPENKAILAKTVTVEVSPTQAERVSVAEDLGKISFALRSLANATEDESKTETKDANANENSEKAVGGPLVLVEDEQDYVSAIMQPKPAPKIQAYTRDRDISPALNRSGGLNPRVLVIRGDTSEQREFVRGRE